jgi:hypothetical protein
MAQIQIRFRAVVRHEHLAMLERAHGAGIHIQIGIQFLREAFVARGGQQIADGGG